MDIDVEHNDANGILHLVMLYRKLCIFFLNLTLIEHVTKGNMSDTDEDKDRG